MARLPLGAGGGPDLWVAGVVVKLCVWLQDIKALISDD